MTATPPLPAKSVLPDALRTDIVKAGYYPQMVAGLIESVMVGEDVIAHLVHQETTFDNAETFRRHITVLVLTATRLLIAHADDHQGAPDVTGPFAASSIETVSLSRIRSSVLSTVVREPEKHNGDGLPDEATVTVCWGTVQRIEMEPATCPDPQCDADHGYTGMATSDDIVVRVSSAADGEDAVAKAIAFAAHMNIVLGPATSGRHA